MNCNDYTSFTASDLDERRKVEILEYKKNSNNFTKAQNFSFLSRGNSYVTKRTFAKQTPLVTDPNVQNLPVVGDAALQCEGVVQQRCQPTYNSDVPGKPNVICRNDGTPLTRYNYKPSYGT